MNFDNNYHFLYLYFICALQTDSLTSSYTQRAASQQQQQQQPQQQISSVSGSSVVGSTGNNALDQLTKNDPYNQSNSATAYQSSYQSSSNVVSNKGVTNAYQPTVASQGYNNSAYGNVQVFSHNYRLFF